MFLKFPYNGTTNCTILFKTLIRFITITNINLFSPYYLDGLRRLRWLPALTKEPYSSSSKSSGASKSLSSTDLKRKKKVKDELSSKSKSEVLRALLFNWGQHVCPILYHWASEWNHARSLKNWFLQNMITKVIRFWLDKRRHF